MALLAMCVAAPDEGRGYLERLTDEHLASPVAARAREWLVGHLDEPLHGLGRDDEELLAYVTEVKMRADREPASPRGDGGELPSLEQRPARPPDRGARARERGPAGRAPEAPRRAQRTDRPLRGGIGARPTRSGGEHTFAVSVRLGWDDAAMDRDLLADCLVGHVAAGDRRADQSRSVDRRVLGQEAWTGRERQAKYASRGGLTREQLEPLVEQRRYASARWRPSSSGASRPFATGSSSFGLRNWDLAAGANGRGRRSTGDRADAHHDGRCRRHGDGESS